MKAKLIHLGTCFKNGCSGNCAMITIPRVFLSELNLTPGKSKFEFYIVDDKYLLLKPLEVEEMDEIIFEEKNRNE